MAKPSRLARLPATDLGPYRLESLLGEGGMGTVFVARDERLGRRVAVKRIPPLALKDPTRMRRFQREARTLASLNHPAIVQIFDLVENAEGSWIVMELVEGPTVAELVAEGPLDIARILAVGRQTAEGLAEAHAQGVLHRDLKGENVILRPLAHDDAERTKILDFGLAKLLEGEPGQPDLSVSGQILGTCRAMSPEQARGLPLDARSDLFSLGVLLYEMTAGEPPFRGETNLDTLRRIVGHPHRPPIAFRPEAPARLSELIDRLLEKSPEHRPASAREVAVELKEIEADLLDSADSPDRRPANRRPANRRPANRRPAPPREKTVGYSSVDQPALDCGTVLSDPVAGPESRGSAAGSASYRTFAWRRHRRTLSMALLLIAVLAALGWETWRRWVLPAPPADPPAAGRSAEPDDFTLFQQGMAYLERFDKPGHLEKAITAFEAVLARDEDSAPAHAGLALAYRWQYTVDRDPLRLEQALAVAERAVRLDEHLALTRVALGTVYAESGRYDEALRELEAALQLEPSNAGAYRGLGIAHKHRGESALAAGAFEKAVEGKPTDPFLRDELGLLYYNGGRYDEAEAQFLKSVESAPDRAYGYRNLSAVYYMQGRLPEAAEALQKALVIKPEHSLYSNLGTILFAQGLYLLSAQAFEKALDHGGANVYLYWANLADAYRQAEGYDEEAREAYLQAIRLLETEVEAQPGNDVLVTRLALYLAKSGDREAALAVLEAADLEEGQASDHYRGAVAYEICGERTAALAALATALRAGFSTSEVARDPELFGLRSDPRYHRLVAEIGAR